MGNHRADRRGSRRSASVTHSEFEPALPSLPASARRPGMPASRGPLFRALPSAPVLAGVATLAVAVGGVVTSGDVIDALPAGARLPPAPVRPAP